MITIPLQIEETWVAGILREHPIEKEFVLDEEGKITLDKDNNVIEKDKYTAVQWIGILAIKYLGGEYKQGSNKIKIDVDSIEKDFIKNAIESNIIIRR